MGSYRTPGIVFDLFHTLVDPEEFRPKEFKRAEVVAVLLGVNKAEFIKYWEGTRRSRLTTPRPEIEYVRDFASKKKVTVPESKFNEADEVLGRYQDLAILNPRNEVMTSIVLMKSRGHALGLLSNTAERDVREWPRSPLAPFFDAAVFSHEIGVLKPDPQAYAAVLGRLHIEPSGCTFVGDGGSGELEGAKRVEFKRVVFMKQFVSKNGLRSREELAAFSRQADFTVDTFEKLSALEL